MSKRDYSFEALVEVTGAELEHLTITERGRINRALAELRVLEPDDYVLHALIHERAKAWRVVYPEMALTPQALAGSWSSIEEKARDVQRAQVKTYNAPPSPTSLLCQTCHGNKMVLVASRPSLNPLSGFDEYSICPDCNADAGAQASYWRYDGSRFVAMDAVDARARLDLIKETQDG